jgi:hypothetical protein
VFKWRKKTTMNLVEEREKKQLSNVHKQKICELAKKVEYFN